MLGGKKNLFHFFIMVKEVFRVPSIITVGASYNRQWWVRDEWNSITILNDLKSIFHWIQVVDDRLDHSYSLNFFFVFEKVMGLSSLLSKSPMCNLAGTYAYVQHWNISNGHREYIKICGKSVLVQLHYYLGYRVVRKLITIAY